MTFKDKYVRHHRIKPEAYAEHFFRRCLYRHAVLIAGVIRNLEPRYFAADFELILSVGDMKQRKGMRSILSQWVHHPDSAGPMRRLGHVRISIARVRRELDAIMAKPDLECGQEDEALAGQVPAAGGEWKDSVQRPRFAE